MNFLTKITKKIFKKAQNFNLEPDFVSRTAGEHLLSLDTQKLKLYSAHKLHKDVSSTCSYDLLFRYLSFSIKICWLMEEIIFSDHTKPKSNDIYQWEIQSVHIGWIHLVLIRTLLSLWNLKEMWVFTGTLIGKDLNWFKIEIFINWTVLLWMLNWLDVIVKIGSLKN